MACAYVDHSDASSLCSDGNASDVVLQDVFSTNPVLIWSFVDMLNPRLILRSPREVHALQFCPFNENLLVGGCSSGQVVVWDLCNKLKLVEEKISLTPNKLKYRLALHSLMGWIKPSTRHKYVNPVVVSSLEFSMRGCVTDIKWLSPHFEISRLGKYHPLKANRLTALQFLTSSVDGTVCVWDLNARGHRTAGTSQPVKSRRKRKTLFKHSESEYVSSFKQLSVFKPHYKFLAENLAPGGCMPLQVLAVEAFPITYRLQTPIDFTRKLSVTERLSYKPEFQKPRDSPKTELYIGTLEGGVVQATWQGHEFNPGDVVNSEILTYTSVGNEHDGPISAIALSPFIKDLILSVGGKVFAIWRSNIKDVPVLWRRAGVQLTGGAWSLFIPSMFFITRADGSVEIWNLLEKSDKPAMTQNIVGNALTGIYPSRLWPFQCVIGLTDSNGNFRVFNLPQEHTLNNPKNKKAVLKFLNREMECKEFAKERQNKWLECNAEMLQAKRLAAEEEMKRKEAERKTKQRIERVKKEREEEELQKKRQREIKSYEKELVSKKKWDAMQLEHLTNVLLEKKHLNEETLVIKKFPLDQLKEDEKRKRLKEKKEIQEKQKKFMESVFLLFPETIDEAAKKDMHMDDVQNDLEKIMSTFTENYKGYEEAALTYKDKNAFECKVDWYQLLAEGRERRNIVDKGLYKDTGRIERYNKSKNERKLAQKLKLEAFQEKELEKKAEPGKHGMSKSGELRHRKKLEVGRKSGKRVVDKSKIG
ncbi:dynein axonemal intermediate chain 3-like isoform X2 [Periplaneta americana]